MLREFGGVSAYVEEVNVEEHFEEYYNNNDRVVYVSRKTFRHEEGDLTFNYKYAIVVTDVGVYTGDGDAPIVVELMLVPSFNDLTEENKKNIRYCYGYDDDVISEEWLWMDVLDYSFAIKIGEKSINNPTNDTRDEWIESEPIKDILDSVVAVYEVIDNLRGFYLDKAWNRIGTTGWDTLRNAIKNESLYKF